VGECVIKHALLDINSVKHQAYGTLFGLAATYIINFGHSEGQTAVRLLIKLSFYPEMLELVSKFVFSQVNEQQLP
jgi:hypothetical protein